MKIVCDCENEMVFNEGVVPHINSDGVINARQDYNKINIIGEHDEVWITCKKCNKSIHMFT